MHVAAPGRQLLPRRLLPPRFWLACGTCQACKCSRTPVAFNWLIDAAKWSRLHPTCLQAAVDPVPHPPHNSPVTRFAHCVCRRGRQDHIAGGVAAAGPAASRGPREACHPVRQPHRERRQPSRLWQQPRSKCVQCRDCQAGSSYRSGKQNCRVTSSEYRDMSASYQ